jgi:hypothetical protein
MQDEAHFTQADRKTLNQLEIKMDRALMDIANLTNNFASKGDLSDLETRLKNVEDNQKWVVRTIIGFVILALMGLIIVNQ